MSESGQLSGLLILGWRVDLFWVGVFGAVLVELTTLAAYYDKGPHPEKYKSPGFWAVKLLLAFSGGVLVQLYGVTTAPAALQIGTSVSALVLALAKGEAPPR